MGMISLLNLPREYEILREEIISDIDRVCKSGSFIGGEAVKLLEYNISSYLGGGHVASCASGTDALQIALMALGLKPGDEVITTPFTFVATAEVISLLGANPVFVDINPRTYNMYPQSYVESMITDKTKGIIAVHLFGQCCQIEHFQELCKKYNLFLIEDCAQSFGAKRNGVLAGNFGDIACFSCFPSKNLGCYGDGGFIYTKSDQLYDDIKCIANHGSRKKYHYDRIGVNSRLDAIQAVILNIKLKYVDDNIKKKNNIAEYYNSAFNNLYLKLPIVDSGNTHTYHQYSICLDDRDRLMKFLSEQLISSCVYYPQLLSESTPYKYCKQSALINTKYVTDRILSIPIDPNLNNNEIEHITSSITKFCQEYNR